jgi:hypothetical protein
MYSTLKMIGLALLVSAVSGASTRDVIHPTGEENLGQIVVKAPDFGTAISPFNYSVTYRNQKVVPGTELRILAGDGCVVLTNLDLGAKQQVCGVEVKKQQKTTFLLSGLVLKWDRQKKDEALNVGFGPQAVFNALWDKAVYLTGQENPQSKLWTGEGKNGLVVMPGNYSFTHRVVAIPPVNSVVNAGQVVTLDLTPPDKRGRILVQFDKREFANWRKAPHYFLWRQNKNNAPKGYVEPYGGAVGTYGVLNLLAFKGPGDDRNEYEAFAFPLTVDAATTHYELVVNNQLVKFDVASGETTTLKIKRIDLDLVTVTEESGKTYTTEGTAVINRKNSDTGEWESMRYPSGSSLYPIAFTTEVGLDVPPGIYQVLVTYQTKEGKQTKEYVIDFSN